MIREVLGTCDFRGISIVLFEGDVSIVAVMRDKASRENLNEVWR